MSELIIVEFKSPNASELWGRFLPKALAPCALLLILIPAYTQIKSIYIFSPMILVALYQFVLFFKIKKTYSTYINRISFDADNNRLHIERTKNGERERIDLPYKTFNIHITKIAYFSAFSYFDIYKLAPNKKVLRQYLCGDWKIKMVQKYLAPYANATKEVVFKSRFN